MLGKTPYELLVYSIPDYYDHVLVFGCLCCTSTATINWKQFDTPGRCCVFLSYACGIKGINCLTLNIKKFLFPRKLFSGSIFPFHDSHNQKAPFDHFDICPNSYDSLVLPHSFPDVDYEDTPSQKSSIIIRTWSTPSSPQHTRINSNS